MKTRRPVLLTENSRTVLVRDGESVPPRNSTQFVAAFVGTISAVCLGMLFTWTSSALINLKKLNIIDENQGSWIGSLVNLGAFAGAIPAGPLANAIGRKRLLQMLIVPLFLHWIVIAYFYHSVPVLYASRFVAGLAGGAISVAAPMYVVELAHLSIRGTLGTFFQVQITVGILIEYVFGWMIVDIMTLSLASSALSIVFIVLFAFMPESPVFLCSKGRMHEAKASMTWFRGESYDMEKELSIIVDDLKEASKNKASISDLINDPATFKALIISLGLMTFQQLSGVNAVLFYANGIFEETNIALSPAQCSILVGIVQVLATLGSTVLIDKAGRKMLLIISEFVMTLSISALGFYFYLNQYHDLSAYSFIPLVSVALFIIFFSLGMGPIPWMLVGEIFSSNAKGVASSVSASLNWLLAFIVTNQFANFVNWFGIGATFLIFAVICGIGTTFITFMIPETKGKNIEEVRRDLLGIKHNGYVIEKQEKVAKMTSVV